MKLFTKCILTPKYELGGTHASVMSRHTLNDGITIDDRITPVLFDQHLLLLAPPSKLMGDYYKRGLCWEDFEKRYLEYLRTQRNNELQVLAARATRHPITLLCIEETPQNCHRRLLAEECRKYQNSLEIIHL